MTDKACDDLEERLSGMLGYLDSHSMPSFVRAVCDAIEELKALREENKKWAELAIQASAQREAIDNLHSRLDRNDALLPAIQAKLAAAEGLVAAAVETCAAYTQCVPSSRVPPKFNQAMTNQFAALAACAAAGMGKEVKHNE